MSYGLTVATDRFPVAATAAGRALGRVFLRLTASSATGAFLNQPVEVESRQPCLRDTLDTTFVPQLLMHFEYGPTVRAPVRRPIAGVLI